MAKFKQGIQNSENGKFLIIYGFYYVGHAPAPFQIKDCNVNVPDISQLMSPSMIDAVLNSKYSSLPKYVCSKITEEKNP